MITTINCGKINCYIGLSTDTKPTGAAIANGSMFYEMDTADIYMYNKTGSTWIKQ